MTSVRNDRFDSSGEYCLDLSDNSSGEDDVTHMEIDPRDAWTSIQQQRDDSCVLTGNTVLLLELSAYISAIWKQVGRHLKMEEYIIENIEIDFERYDAAEKAYQLLLAWSRRLGSDATLKKLLNALVLMGKYDIANKISGTNNQQRRLLAGSENGRAIKLEMKNHAKLQKQVLRELKKALQDYEQRLREVEEIRQKASGGREADVMMQKLQELDKNLIQGKLDSLHAQVRKMQENDHVKYSVLDRQLRMVADKVHEIAETFKTFNDELDDLRVSYYSKVECAFGGLCYFRHVKFPRSNSSVVKHSSRPSSNADEHLSHSKASCRPRLAQEEHTNRKLSVSINDVEEQSQLQDFLNKFCPRYRNNCAFTDYHRSTIGDLLGLRDESMFAGQSFSCGGDPRILHDENISMDSSLSTIDPNTLPIPRYQSTERIISLVTSSLESQPPKGLFNVASVWI